MVIRCSTAEPACYFLPGGTGPARDPAMLGHVRFTDRAEGPHVTDGSGIGLSVHSTRDPGSGFTETWFAAGPVETGEYAGIAYGHDQESIFCAVRIPQADRYADAVEFAYGNLMDLLENKEFGTLHRVWHYVAGLNDANKDGLEVYRDFCLGRARLLESRNLTRTMPAATVIGARGGGIVVYLLAGRAKDRVDVENPAQTPAYDYPGRYGPKAPNFARASWVPTEGGRGRLFVSGTAAITGHRSLHPEDVVAQSNLALDNMARVIGAPNLARHGIGHGYELTDVRTAKVYVRRPQDLDTVRSICRRRLAPEADVRYLAADVCRSDLLMELEGIAW